MSYGAIAVVHIYVFNIAKSWVVVAAAGIAAYFVKEIDVLVVGYFVFAHLETAYGNVYHRVAKREHTTGYMYEFNAGRGGACKTYCNIVIGIAAVFVINCPF